MLTSLKRTLGAPLVRYFDFRFSELGARVDEVRQALQRSEVLDLRRADALARVDVRRHNAGRTPPDFSRVVCQVVSASQFATPDFQRLAQLVTGAQEPLPWEPDTWPLGRLERKLWEWCYILRAAEQSGKLAPGVEAVGFGVGREPLPAALASFGVHVLATDRDPGDSEEWAKSNQHMGGLDALSRPHLLSSSELGERVRTKYVDMNDVPADLGSFDLMWSSCAMEHLGSPEAGLEFVLRTLRHLRPGGISVHTTELELTMRASTGDYGHLAVYRLEDLERLRQSAIAQEHEMPANWYVALESPADRWISLPPHPEEDRFHLKLLVGDSSVSTSVGLMISRPDSAGEASAS